MAEVLARNKKAYHDYEIKETLEAGIVLKGSEVKALRAKKVNLKDSFIKIVKGVPTLFNMHIGVLNTTNRYFAHEERRPRDLLLHKKEIAKLASATEKEGYTIVPLSIYFNKKNIAKVKIALAKGKKLYDKRAELKKKDQQRDILRSLKEHYR